MRVTNSLFYKNTINNYQSTMQELFKTNAQIASGLKIQNSFEDSSIYIDTMRLSYEIATLKQVKESTSKAQASANNTDKIMNQFSDALDKFKTKLIKASSASNTKTSLNALAMELSSLREHMISLGNTSINGQYLFAGTSFATKPLDAYGNYSGNGGLIKAIIGSGVKLPYNINGKDLFLGRDSDYSKVLSTNVKMLNQTKLHPDIMMGNGELSKEVYLNEKNTIRDLVGDNDNDASNDPNSMFYLSGRKSDGTTFSSKFEISSSSKVSDLLEKIGQEYGNTSTNSVVDVTMNSHGQIEIKDLKNGRVFLEMNLFGAVDRDGTAGTAGNANQADIDNLLASSNVDIIEFSKSNFKTVNSSTTVSSREDIFNQGLFRVGYPLEKTDGSDVDATTLLSDFMPPNVNNILIGVTSLAIAGQTVQDLMSAIETEYGLNPGSARIENGQIIVDDPTRNFNATLVARDLINNPVEAFSIPDSMNYERRGFKKDGNNLSSNISQMVKSTNDYATNKTKLSEVAGVALNTKQFALNGIDSSGNSFNAQIDFGNPTSTFSLDGGITNYTIFDATGGSTAANDMTYRQLGDIVSMITSGNLPATTNTFSDYTNSISSSKGAVEVGLDYKGRLEIHDKFNSKSPIEFSMFDTNADDSSNASALTFMANDAVKIEDPNMDFFKDLDEMIDSVRTGRFRMDGNADDPRKIGMQNSLSRIDHIMDHLTKEHTKIGTYSNALKQANISSALMIINIKEVRSSVINTDTAEAYLKLTQLTNSYKAMLSTAAKINSMSLLNYM